MLPSEQLFPWVLAGWSKSDQEMVQGRGQLLLILLVPLGFLICSEKGRSNSDRFFMAFSRSLKWDSSDKPLNSCKVPLCAGAN